MLLFPAISNRTCHAKLRVPRKSLNSQSHGTTILIRWIQPVFAFGIVLFASEHQLPVRIVIGDFTADLLPSSPSNHNGAQNCAFIPACPALG